MSISNKKKKAVKIIVTLTRQNRKPKDLQPNIQWSKLIVCSLIHWQISIRRF